MVLLFHRLLLTGGFHRCHKRGWLRSLFTWCSARSSCCTHFTLIGPIFMHRASTARSLFPSLTQTLLHPAPAIWFKKKKVAVCKKSHRKLSRKRRNKNETINQQWNREIYRLQFKNRDAKLYCIFCRQVWWVNYEKWNKSCKSWVIALLQKMSNNSLKTVV